MERSLEVETRNFSRRNPRFAEWKMRSLLIVASLDASLIFKLDPPNNIVRFIDDCSNLY